jgi:hypothetical protein
MRYHAAYRPKLESCFTDITANTGLKPYSHWS